MRCFVVGAGSIGLRHCRNLVALGQMVTVWDVDAARLGDAAALPGVVAASGLDAGLAAGPDAVLVCTPPALHVDVARRALEADAHVFVEKPIAASSDEVPELLDLAKRRGRTLAVGYNLRFLPGLRRVKTLLDAGRIGHVLSARAEFGFFLPRWRAGRDYRDNYAIRKDLGGGILLDAIHEFDYLGWLLGRVSEVFCAADHVSSLAGDTEDLAELILRFSTGALGQVHLDYVRRAYRRMLELSGTDGLITWDYATRLVTVVGGDGSVVEQQGGDVDGLPEGMYLEELRHFVSCLERGEAPAVDGAEALRSLRVVEAAKTSAERGGWVTVPG
jgi:predicted dehydrogenase